jgi:uncharacterized protein YeeX (DUF496 family)
VSVEIGGIEINLLDNQKAVEVKATYVFYGKYNLSKQELAQLITALQEMHDKMIDNNEGL